MSSFQLECSVLKKSWGNLLFGENEMTREKLEKYIQNNYSAEPDYPWVKYPDYEVFRHTSNKKWFALIMEIPKDKLGLQGNPIRLYSLDEITEIFCKLGLRICNNFADFSGKPSSDNDIQLMVYSIRE